MVYIRSSAFLIFLLYSMMFMQSCALRSHQIEAEYLFSIPLGVLPGEFKVWKSSSVPYRSSFFMRNGVFYIGNTNRIMVFSSTGLLINFIAPSYEPSYGNILQYSTKGIPYYSYPIGLVGEIVSDASGKIIFSNTLISEAKFNTTDYAVVQLLIYENNEMKKILGRIGKEQFNFLSVKNIFIRNNSQIVVLNKDETSSTLYFFDKKGYMVKSVFFKDGRFPVYPQERYKESIAKSTKIKAIPIAIVPSPNREIVYVHINYYNLISDEGKGENVQQVQFRRTIVYAFNTISRKYSKMIDIPSISSSHVLRKVMNNGNMVFLGVEVSEEQKQYFSVVLASQEGKELRHYNLFFPLDDYISYEATLNSSGKLGAYFVGDERVDVFWWNLSSFSAAY